MRPHYTHAQRPTVDQVLSEARQAVASARAQRDQLEAALRDAQADNEALRRKLQAHEMSRSDRLQADLDNIRRQHAAEVRRARHQGLAEAVAPLAEVMDHLGRALAAQPDPEDPWFRGTAAILARTRASLAALGVEPVGAMGDRFDPALHDAVGTVRTDEVPAGSIVDVLKTGLRLTETGTLVRPASVVVAEGGA
ncbi:MAG: nucleotide exchange factor GrpE [Alphaproteobacteria bacterium]|nr:nucleotide exchange factor GrpE [Alphaproteobacteria bacterium]